MKPIPFLFAFIFLVGCSGENSNLTLNVTDPVNEVLDVENVLDNFKQEVFKDAPFEGIEKPFMEFNYDGSKGGRYELASGTLIEIPKHAFEDKDGNPVDKKIKIKYREYHDVQDIILSGIKMNYNEADTSGDFESAGMFEIRAEDENGELNLNEGTAIDIELASFKDGDFNKYQMNQTTYEWEYMDNSIPETNFRKEQRLNELEAKIEEEESVQKSTCNIEPTEYKNGFELFDLDYDFIRYKEMEMFHEAMWVHTGTAKEKRALEASLRSYNDMELLPSETCDEYELTLWHRSVTDEVTNKKTFRIKPVWRGSAFKKIKKNYKEKMSAFNKKIKELSEARQIAEREADLVRNFEIKGMGIFNCDRIINAAKFIAVALVLKCSQKIKSFFYITFNRSASIRYYNPTVDGFKYIPNSTNSIIAILPGNKTGIVTEEMFAQAYDDYKKDADPNKILEIEMKVQDNEIKQEQDFKDNFASL